MRTYVTRARGVVVLGTVAAMAAVGLTAGAPADGAAKAVPCANKVTALDLLSTSKFAAGGRLKRFRATVDFPGRTGFYDQTARALLGVYPSGSLPALVNPRIGDRATVGSMVISQRSTSLAAINGDFFIYRTIQGKAVEFSRGPMIRDGVILRADKDLSRAVGVDTTGQPFGGSVGARGTIRIGQGSKTPLAGINWDTVQSGGFTLFTPDWSRFSASPRPAGVGEWVLNRRNKIVEVRTASINAAKRGAVVQAKTKVIAFPTALAAVAAGGAVGQKVRLTRSQSTDTGVALTTAVGRGVNLVKRGVAAPQGCEAYDHSAAARPRTVIGWTKSGAWRSITVPGHQLSGTSRTGGFGLANTAALAKKLGMRFAFELDGGASTTLYTRSNGGVWSRRDLYGVSGGTYERPVVNGLAFLAPPATATP